MDFPFMQNSGNETA